MTVAASSAVFGFGPQTAKGTLATTWYRHKATRVNVGSQQVVEQFPAEIGGGFHPTGAYKRMAFGAGQAIVNPRLENVIGWLLYAAAGRVSTVANTPETGMHRHIFSPPTTASGMKWLSVRRYIPGASGASDNLGEVLKDCRCAGFRLACAPGTIATAAFTFVGREPKLSETGVDSWTWANDYERYPSVPLAHQGSLSLDGTEQPATNVVVDLTNQYTTPQEEMIIGSPYPDDLILRRQTLTVTWTYKWQDPDLYKALLTGTNSESSGLIDWSPTVHTASFELDLYSPGNVSGKSNPYRLRVYATEFTWQAAGPPELIGDGWLSLEFTGVAQEQTSGNTFEIWLENEVSAYSWPT